MVDYDFLIVATGAAHAYFGHDEWRRVAPGLKTLEDALEIRRRVLLAFERAERETDPDAASGAAHLRRHRRRTDRCRDGGRARGDLAAVAGTRLPAFRPGIIRILLLEGGPTILGAFPETLREAAMHDLRRLGVTVCTGSIVTDVAAGRVAIGSESIRAETVLWAAGVSASPLGAALGVPVDRAGRVKVLPDLTIPGAPNVFVIGDLATLAGPDGRPLPGVAQVAIQMGKHAVRNILRALEHQPLRPFHYQDLGNMATIGRASAIADFGRLRLSGLLAWLAWLFVHILNLIGFRNRLVVFMQWAWAYFTYQRSIRLITGDDRG